MRRNSFVVTDDGSTPEQPLVECFYCPAKVGEEHEDGCVMRRRTVVLRAVVEFVSVEPEDSDKERLEFKYNEGSWCMNNVVDLIAKHIGDGPVCLCNTQVLGQMTQKPGEFTFMGDVYRTPFDSKIEYVREATDVDESFSALHVADLTD